MLTFAEFQEIKYRAGLGRTSIGEAKEMPKDKALAILKHYGFDASDAGVDQLKQQRRILGRKHHPDWGGGAALGEINAAIDSLMQLYGGAVPQDLAGAPKPKANRRPATANRSYQEEQPDDYENMKQEFRQRRPKSGGRDDAAPEWAWAGHSGGLPPNAMIYRQDYSDMNYIKKKMWEKSGKSRDQWTIWAYDGSFFRGTLTVFGNKRIFSEMAKAMIVWNGSGNPYATRAVFVSPESSQDLLLIYLDKMFLNQALPMEHDSFNRNPSNDSQFMQKLPDQLDKISAYLKKNGTFT